jgi:hypothetical protein
VSVKKMARKIFKASDIKLHILTSINGVIIVKVVDDHEVINEANFTSIGYELEDFLNEYTTKTKSILNYLNNIS